MIAAITPGEHFQALLDGREHAPFALLGPHHDAAGTQVRVCLPHAIAAAIIVGATKLPLQRRGASTIFEFRFPGRAQLGQYRIEWQDGSGATHSTFDAYAFPPEISGFDLYLFGSGRHWHAYRVLGAHARVRDGVAGVRFATWAPNAERVSVVGDFNRWDGRCHPMQVHGSSGVWDLFLPELAPGAIYKYEIRNRHDGSLHLKTDPYGQRFEHRPATAAIVPEPAGFAWQDAAWIADRSGTSWLNRPCSIYEVHLGSWRRAAGKAPSYRQLAETLVAYVRDLGFTHIELLPLTEHPLDESWGYQTTGYFAATSRYGTPDELRLLIDTCHRQGIGVLLDWAPAHFPRDTYALARFDGSAVYEHEDPRRGEHGDWGTLIFNYGRYEVKNFLLSSALYWIEEFHIDGLRVDAVSSMLYLDYSKRDGEWLPNEYGGRETLEAIAFLRELNTVVHAEHPGCLVIAEESTSWPGVSRPVDGGGLGFSMKWNMGWMHDTLLYLGLDPIYRRYHHRELTFGMLYAFTENFILPFSHDEVVHGKGSLLGRMPGDDWQRFANLRLLFTYQFTYPGKKLLFMGGEFGQWREWDCGGELDWQLLAHAPHRGLHDLVRDLNRLYRELPCLHRLDFEAEGFIWLDCDDADNSVIAYRRGDGEGNSAIVALNFTPVPRYGYRIGVPFGGRYREILNSDSLHYGGGNLGNTAWVEALASPQGTWPHCLELTLPPLSGVVLVPER
ncbi:MAG: 1,4-alpha-glucan branching protein GlgB [Gammaproteobacteria bacterium]|nr:1,4-alpha-glucan branching protein GlgB [Gammaproteobacteria bacterium]